MTPVINETANQEDFRISYVVPFKFCLAKTEILSNPNMNKNTHFLRNSMLCTIRIQKFVQLRDFILKTVINSVEYFFPTPGTSNW